MMACVSLTIMMSESMLRMTRSAALFLIVFAVSLPLEAASAEAGLPPLPYKDWDACPFECCVYRTWVAEAGTLAHKGPSFSSPERFSIAKGEKVEAITGVVITRKAGMVKVLKETTLYPNSDNSPLPLNAGDVIYTLHYLGEGFWLFWFRGKEYQADMPSVEYPDPTGVFSVVANPKTEWWVLVRNAKGQVGWCDADDFGGNDACG